MFRPCTESPRGVQGGWMLWNHPCLWFLPTIYCFLLLGLSSKVPRKPWWQEKWAWWGAVACKEWSRQSFKRLHLGIGQVTSQQWTTVCFKQNGDIVVLGLEGSRNLDTEPWGYLLLGHIAVYDHHLGTYQE